MTTPDQRVEAATASGELDAAVLLPDDAPKPGDVFAGKYAVERLIGSGGMGYVLAARHIQLDERVAIKLLLRGEASRPEGVARFLREARASVKIRSEHVVRVLDVGDERGRPYIVMEYLEGADLAAILKQHRRLPHDLAVDYLLQACEALAEAHALGIVHRDLKPANLFVTRLPDGTDSVKVLDFGISKILDGGPDAVAMTVTSATIGTPLYMSPEQLKSSKKVDVRTDLWSLGVILFELLAGRRPFEAGSLAELGALVLREDAPDVRSFAADVPPALARAVASCLARDVEQRAQSIGELAVLLAPFGTDAGRRSSRGIVNVLARSSPRHTPVAAATPSSGAEARLEDSDTVRAESAPSELPRLALTDATWTDDARRSELAAPPSIRRGRPIGFVVGGSALLLVAGGFVARGFLQRPPPAVGPPVVATSVVVPSAPEPQVGPSGVAASASAAAAGEPVSASVPRPRAGVASAAPHHHASPRPPGPRPSATVTTAASAPRGLDGFSTDRHD